MKVLTVAELIIVLMKVENKKATVSFYSPFEPYPVATVNQSEDTTHIYLSYK